MLYFKKNQIQLNFLVLPNDFISEEILIPYYFLGLNSEIGHISCSPWEPLTELEVQACEQGRQILKKWVAELKFLPTHFQFFL